MVEAELLGLALDAARRVVGEVAPDELDVFEDAVAPALERSGRMDEEMLAFGVDTVAVLVAPVALAAANTVLQGIFTATAEEVTASVRDRVRAFFRRNPEGSAGWGRTHAAALASARAAGASDEQAVLIANATVGALALGV